MPVVRPKNIVKRTSDVQRPEKVDRTLNLHDFFEKRNKILIIRNSGGFGDILMHRMLFEDIKQMAPNCETHFACPTGYHDIVMDHPFIDKILDSQVVQKFDYIVSYNTTTACVRYEVKKSPYSDKHRSDIWANHCGFDLQNHNMHITLTQEEKEKGLKIISEYRDREGPVVIISPISAMRNKNLLKHQLLGLAHGLRDRGYCPMGIHNQPLFDLSKHNIPAITGLKGRQWMSVLYQADYVISVDSAAFHCAGGMNKPVVGIFTFVNGAVYSKYYPNVELVQGPCPFGIPGCYNPDNCQKPQEELFVPCIFQIRAENLLAAFDRLVAKFPINSIN